MEVASPSSRSLCTTFVYLLFLPTVVPALARASHFNMRVNDERERHSQNEELSHLVLSITGEDATDILSQTSNAGRQDSTQHLLTTPLFSQHYLGQAVSRIGQKIPSFSLGSRLERKLIENASDIATLAYRGGPVLTNPISIYIIWYGGWTTNQKAIVHTFLDSLGPNSTATSSPSLEGWWATVTQYIDGTGLGVSNVVARAAEIDYLGTVNTNWTDPVLDTTAVVNSSISSSSLPSDTRGIYFVMTAQEVSVSAPCPLRHGGNCQALVNPPCHYHLF